MVAALLLLALFVVLNSCQSIAEAHKRCTRLAGALEANSDEMHSKVGLRCGEIEWWTKAVLF